MCGKYILAQAAKAERAMGIRRGRWEYPLSYRVLPTEQVPVVVNEAGERAARMMRWGLIPLLGSGRTAEGPPPSTPPSSASRAHRATATPGSAASAASSVMVGFYEPHVNEDGSRDPYFVHLERPGGLRCRGPVGSLAARADGAPVFSCTLITVPANRLLAEVHNAKQRMPAILREADHELWLAGARSLRTPCWDPTRTGS